MITKRATAAMLLWAMATVAADAAADCFCLTHPSTGSVVHYGCTASVPANRFTPIVRCLSPDRRFTERVEDAQRWAHLPGGDGACNPCAPGPDDPVPDVPRTLPELSPNQ